MAFLDLTDRPDLPGLRPLHPGRAGPVPRAEPRPAAWPAATRYAALGNDFLDGIQGLPTLKAFGQSRAHGDLLADRARHLYRSTMCVLAANIATGGVTMLGISAGAAVALAWGAVRVQQGTLRAPDAADRADARRRGVPPAARAGRALPPRAWSRCRRRRRSTSCSTRSRRCVDPAESRPTEPRRRPLRSPPDGRASRTSRSRYPARTRRGAAATSPSRCGPGETLGVVGPSGAGKSTLVWLLLRFFDPAAGRVLVGGRDVRELPLDELREPIAVVAQDTYLFHGTVAENLRIGKPDATQAELEAAARAANAHEFISALPQRLRHRRRRARRPALRRPAPAHRHRPRAAEGRARSWCWTRRSPAWTPRTRR